MLLRTASIREFCTEAAGHFTKLVQRIERSTLDGAYLVGNEFSLADIAAAPYTIRLDMLRLSSMWDSFRGLPRWYDRLKEQPSVAQAIVGSMAATDKAPFDGIGFDPWPKVSRILSEA
jgi:glutathione S-transferase